MKDFIIYSEFFKAGIYPPLVRDQIDEINFRVHEGERTDFEFMLKFEKLGQGTTLRLEMFDDSFKAFSRCPEVFHLLGSYHDDKKKLPEDILEKIAVELQELGWKRKAPPPQEVKKRVPVCPTCGHAGEAER